MDGLQEKDDQSDANTNADEVELDPTPFNPLFTSQDVDDKRLLYNRFNNHNETTGCDESLDATAGGGQTQGTRTGDDNNIEYDDDEDSAATRPPSHPESKYIMDMNNAEQNSLRSAVGAFAVRGRSHQRIYAGGTGGVTPDAAVSSQLNGHVSLQHQSREDRPGASIEQSLAGQNEEGVPLSPQEEPQSSASNQAEIDDQPSPSTATDEPNTAPIIIANTAPTIIARARASSVVLQQSSYDAAVPEAVLVEGGAAIEAEPIDEKRTKMTRIVLGSCIVFLILLVAILTGVLVRSNNEISDEAITDPGEPEVATQPAYYIGYNTGGCIGRNEIWSPNKPVVEECAAACEAVPACVSFEYKKSGTDCKLSTTCDEFSLTVDDPDDNYMWYLKVTDDAIRSQNPVGNAYLWLLNNLGQGHVIPPLGLVNTTYYNGYSTGGCIGRNELSWHLPEPLTTPTVEDCAALCKAEEECVSFEYQKAGTFCKLSTTCGDVSLTVSNPGSNYMWYEKLNEYTMHNQTGGDAYLWLIN